MVGNTRFTDPRAPTLPATAAALRHGGQSLSTMWQLLTWLMWVGTGHPGNRGQNDLFHHRQLSGDFTEEVAVELGFEDGDVP